MVTFPFGGGSDGTWRDKLARLERENADGARIVPQVSSHRQGLFCGLRTVAPVRGRPTLRGDRATCPSPSRRAGMAEPDDARPRSSPSARRPACPRLPRPDARRRRDACSRRHPLPEHEPDPSTSLAAQAAALGPRSRGAPLRLDHRRRRRGARALLPRRLRRRTSTPASRSWCTRPRVLGLGDGGAHVDLICDAGYPSFLLSYWVRERARGTLPLETAIRVLTSEPAAHVRPARPRCRSRPGYKADLNVLDPTRSHRSPSRSCTTSRPGAKRVLQRADGFVATIVNGEVVQRDGDDTGARPGRVVRSARQQLSAAAARSRAAPAPLPDHLGRRPPHRAPRPVRRPHARARSPTSRRAWSSSTTAARRGPTRTTCSRTSG